MTDLYLDPITHDLVLENTDLKLVENTTDDPGETKQAAKVTFKSSRGEWLFDTDFGFPYLQEAFFKNPDMDALTARARIIASEVLGVTRVKEVKLEIDKTTREMTGYIELDTNTGITIVEF